MSFQEEIFDKIEAYLSGDLDAGEVAAFEKQISADDLLKAEVEKHKVANALIMEQRLLSVKNILQEERTKDSNSDSSFRSFGLGILAAVVVGVGASIWMSNKEEAVVPVDKDLNASGQIVSANRASDKSTSVHKNSVEQNTSTYSSPSEDIGFHKQQIQQIEEHLQVDEKGVLHIDSSFVVKRVDVKTLANTPTPDKVETPVNLCSNVSIQATVKTAASCNHEATGNILVTNIQGGTKPYSITLSSAANDAVTNGALSKGIYQAVVSDANGCIQTYPGIVVAEKECPRDYSFNPFYGDEEWYIAPYHSEGHLEIYDKGGMLYYQRTISASVAFKWSGAGNNNQTIPGYYIFVIKYADGTSQRGSVTIVQ